MSAATPTAVAVPTVTASQVRGYHQEQGKQIKGKVNAGHVTDYLIARPAVTLQILEGTTDWRGSRGRLPVATVNEVAAKILEDLK